MSQSQKRTPQTKPVQPTSKNFLKCLQECVDDKSTVEILTDSREITGILSIVGADFIGIVSAVERSIESTSVGQDGVAEKQQNIKVFELETFIKFEDLRAVSRVLKSRFK